MSMVPRYGNARALSKAWLLVFLPLLAAASPARPLRLLVFGDSLAAGYGLPHDQGFEQRLAAALKADGYIVQILDGAVSGDTSAGGAARIAWSLADNPDAAIVELGGNDALRALDPQAMRANLATILDALAARHVPTLLAGMQAPRNLGAAYDTQFTDMFATLARRPGLLFEPFFLQDVATIPALNQADGIHPNPAGVAIVVAHIKPLVEKLLQKAGARP
jgi:acyl-CoA thioesterase-1